MDKQEAIEKAGANKSTMQAILTCQVIDEVEKHGVITRAKAIRINCKNYGFEDRARMHSGVPVMADCVFRKLINIGYIYKKEPGLYVKCN